MSDYIIRATAANGMVRAFVADTTKMVKEARRLHGLSPVASVALGRALTAAAIMSLTLKGEKDTLTLQVKGDGPLGGIIAVSDAKANVRGYVHNPEAEVPLNSQGMLDVASAIGKKGYMNVIKDFGLKEPYIGYVRLVSGEIGEDLSYYYYYSEQIPSVVALGVLVGADGEILNAGGFLIQLMPDAEESLITFIEDKIAGMPPLTTLLSEGKTPENILDLILGEKDIKINATLDTGYSCNCSRDRMERNLISLGREEIVSMIDEQKGIELQCHFCNNKYWFSNEELESLAKEV